MDKTTLALAAALRTLVIVFAMGATVATAQSSSPVTFNIEAQPLEDALNKFADQAGYQVLFQSALVQKQTAPRVNGTFTPETALQSLLSTSGLHYKFVNSRTVAIDVGSSAATS